MHTAPPFSMARDPIRGLLCLLVATTVSPGLADDRESTVRDARSGTELVEQLGANEFSVRERATTLLVRLGGQSIAALKAGAESSDREIRFRCNRILTIVRDRELEHRLSRLLNDRDNDADYGLAGWRLYREVAGDSPESRRLFVAMTRAEAELLQAVETGKDAAAAAANERLQQLDFASRQQRSVARIGTLAALLLAQGMATDGAPAGGEVHLAGYLIDRNFSESARVGTQSEVLQKLLGKWIVGVDNARAYEAMLVAYECGTREGLVLAEREIRDGIEALRQPNQDLVPRAPADAPQPPAGRDSQVLTRQMALYLIIKLGGERHVSLVEGLLEDDSRIGKQQIRDLALFTIVRQSHQDPADYGFSRPRNGELGAQISTSLETDEIREQSIQKWREYRARHP